MSKNDHTYLQVAAKKDEPGLNIITYRPGRSNSYYSNYSDYVACLKDQKAWRFITPGLSMCERQAVIVDFDIPFKDELIPIILKQCREYKLAFPNYVLVNQERKSNPAEMYHFQVGWLFDQPLKTTDLSWSGSSEGRDYTNLIYILLSLFTLGEAQHQGDTNFTGSRIRNPYCDYNQRVIWLNEDSRVNRIEFMSRVRELDSEKMILKSREELKRVAILNNKISESSKVKSSRNCAGLRKACAFIRKYKLEHDTWPSLDEVIKVVEDAEWEIVILYPEKGGIEEPAIIKRTAEAALKYMCEHYRYLPSADEKRALSLYIRQIRRVYNTVYMRLRKEEGVLQKDIAQELGMNRISICRLAKDETPQEVYVQQLHEYVQKGIRSKGAKSLEGEVVELLSMMEEEDAV